LQPSYGREIDEEDFNGVHDILKSEGLVYEIKERMEGKEVIYPSLTEKGKEVADLLGEIKEVLKTG
jgi:hypothetical protein